MSSSAVASPGAGPAITVERVSKCYQVYAKPRDRLAQALFGARRTYYREFWALRDVSFEVPRGETMGIVGRNGSGKSTLLQVICGTVSPTTGSARVQGRVAALLELGSGFNPDMTGRENVYMNGAILGLERAEIDHRFDAIAAFSEIAAFLDQPIKTYSSGMTLRLAFAVAINVDAEVLVVDEALAVGDARFQLKCAKAMDRLRDAGKTLLFVSHDPGAVKRLCSEAILLDGGRMLLRAAPNSVLNVYSKLLSSDRGPEAVATDIAHIEEGRARPGAAPSEAQTRAKAESDGRAAMLLDADRQHTPVTGDEFAYGGELGRIESILVTNEAGSPATTFTTGAHARVDILLAVGDKPLADTIYAIMLKDSRGVDVYGTNTYFQHATTPEMPAGSRFRVSFDLAMNLMAGTYFLSVGWTYFEEALLKVVHRRYDAVSLTVLPEDRSIGVANCFATIDFERVE